MRYHHKSGLWLVLIGFAFIAAIVLHDSLEFREVLLLIALCFFCELIDSSLGMGYGTILTPTLLILGYAPSDIVPTILLSEFLTGFAAAFFHHEIKNVELGWRGRDLRPAAILAGGSVLGVAVGVIVAVHLSTELLSMLIGCIILGSGIFVLLLARRTIRYATWKMLTLSAVASFNKAISGGGYGPLVTSGQILSGMRSKASVGITSFAEAFTCLFAIVLFLAHGGTINPVLFVPMCAGGLASVPFAVFAISRTRELYLKYIIGIITATMGLLTIYQAIRR